MRPGSFRIWRASHVLSLAGVDHLRGQCRTHCLVHVRYRCAMPSEWFMPMNAHKRRLMLRGFGWTFSVVACIVAFSTSMRLLGARADVPETLELCAALLCVVAGLHLVLAAREVTRSERPA